MAHSNAEAHLSPEELLRASTQLAASELDRLVSQLLSLRARRSAPSLPERETELLMKINQGLPAELDRRYRELIGKRDEGTLSSAEHQKLLRLTDEVEGYNVERVEHLVELAKLRKTSLGELVEELGLHPTKNG